MKRILLSTFFLWAALTLAPTAFAGNLHVDWTGSPTCKDGSATAANCPVTGWSLWTTPCTSAGQFPSPFSGSPTVTVPASPTSYDFAGTPDGTTWCITIAQMSGTTVGIQSNVAFGTATTTALAPGAPSVTVPPATSLKTTGTAVFLVTNTPNGFGFTQVGTVPVGSPCLGGSGANQYNTVDQTKVTVSWSTAIQAINVVALCQ